MSKKVKFQFGIEFQIDLISMMLKSLSFLLLCKKYVKVEFFSTSRLEYFVKNIYDYHFKYNTYPDKTFLKSISREKLDRVLINKFFDDRVIRELFIRDKVEEFVKRSIFMDLYINVGESYNKNAGNPDIAFSLMDEGMQKIQNVNLNEDRFSFLFKDFDDRLIEREQKINTNEVFKIKTGIRRLDSLIGGGIGGGEVGLIMGDAKGGKSITLIEFGTQAVKRYETVLHIQLEGKKEELYDRYDSNFLDYKYSEIVQNNISQELLSKMHRISNKRKKRDLIMRSYTDWDSCSIIDIEHDYLELRSQKLNPRLIIIDYMDLMKSRKNYNEERFRQQSIIRDIKTFAVKYNVAIWTATQANRPKDKKDDPEFFFTSEHLSEDYGKVRAVDHLISINANSEEMKKNKARIWLDSSRSGKSREMTSINRNLQNIRGYVHPSMVVAIPENPNEKKIIKKKKNIIKK